MEFLRQLVYNDSDFTDKFLEFESIGELPDDEPCFEENDEQYDDVNTDNIIELDYSQESTATTSSGVSSSVSLSQPTSSQADTKSLCGKCLEREKDSLMSCSHAICKVCFDGHVNERKKYCEANIRSKRRRGKEEQNLLCPFDKCRKQINSMVFPMRLDL